MTKEGYIEDLRTELVGRVSPEKSAETIRYYEDYIDDAVRSGRSVDDVLSELGPARLIVKSIGDAQDAKIQKQVEAAHEEEKQRQHERKKEERKLTLLSMLLQRKYRWIFLVIGLALLILMIIIVIVIAALAAYWLLPVVLVIALFLILLRVFIRIHGE